MQEDRIEGVELMRDGQELSSDRQGEVSSLSEPITLKDENTESDVEEDEDEDELREDDEHGIPYTQVMSSYDQNFKKFSSGAQLWVISLHRLSRISSPRHRAAPRHFPNTWRDPPHVRMFIKARHSDKNSGRSQGPKCDMRGLERRGRPSTCLRSYCVYANLPV